MDFLFFFDFLSFLLFFDRLFFFLALSSELDLLDDELFESEEELRLEESLSESSLLSSEESDEVSLDLRFFFPFLSLFAAFSFLLLLFLSFFDFFGMLSPI